MCNRVYGLYYNDYGHDHKLYMMSDDIEVLKSAASQLFSTKCTDPNFDNYIYILPFNLSDKENLFVEDECAVRDGILLYNPSTNNWYIW